MGGSYQYHLSGGIIQKSVLRVAILSLRRWVRLEPKLHEWLRHALAKLPERDSARSEFEHLERQLPRMGDSEIAKDQIATVHRSWLAELEAASPQGRALLLYQQLSAAYVLGRALPSLPSSEKSASRPERVAEQHMLNCL